jgi:hypothetical protein
VSRSTDQSGVALLQVLLVTIVFSLLALQFTKSAQTQISIAAAVENRVTTQLAVESTFNEVIFNYLSDTSVPFDVGADESNVRYSGPLMTWAEPVQWTADILVQIQDLNGLLPQQYPSHPLWREVLRNRGLEEEVIDTYLGVWRDMLDADINSWSFGDVEPKTLPTGQVYLNSIPQTNHVLNWVFSDRPQLSDFLNQISHIEAPFDTNIYNAPSRLLDILLEESLSDTIQTLDENNARSKLPAEMLPAVLRRENIFIYESGRLLVTISARTDTGYWISDWIVQRTLEQDSPYSIIRK